MKLQHPPPRYTPTIEAQRNRDIEREDALNHKKNQNIEVGAASLIVTDATTGTRYELFVDGGSLLVQKADVVDATRVIVARLE